MRTIWKYSISPNSTQGLYLPQNAKLIHVGDQHGVLSLWFELDPSNTTELREFIVYGTGWAMIEDGMAYHHVGSVQSGEFVWHVYERKDI